MKKVPQYVKNVTKSIMNSGKDMISSTMPNTSSFITTNSEVLQSVTNDLRNLRTTTKNYTTRVNNSTGAKIVKDIKNNIIEDLKSGNWNNKVREEAVISKSSFASEMDFGDFNFDFDMDEGFDEDGGMPGKTKLDNTVSSGDLALLDAQKEGMSTLAGVQAASASNIAKTSIRNADLIIRNRNNIHAIETTNNYKMHGMTMNALTGIDASLQRLSNFTEEQAKYMNESLSVMNSQKQLLAELNAYTKEATEMKRNMYREYGENNKTKIQKNHFTDMFDSNNQLELDSYLKKIKKSSKEAFDGSMIGMMWSMGNMMGVNPIELIAANPMKFISDVAVKKMIPKSVKNSMSNLDKTISGFTKAGMHKMSSKFKNKEYDSPIYGILSQVLGLDIGVDASISTAKYTKGAVPYDGVSKQALVEVIPTYLRQIASGINGTPEQIYNYKTGKFVSRKTVDKARKFEMENSYNTTRGSETRLVDELKKLNLDTDSLKTLTDGVNTMFKIMTDTGQFWNPNDTKGYSQFMSNSGNHTMELMEEEFDVINKVAKSLGEKFMYELEDQVTDSFGKRKTSIANINKELGMTGLGALFNNSDKGISKQLTKKGGLLNYIPQDAYGKTMNDYARDIRTILLEGVKVFGYEGGKTSIGDNTSHDNRMNRYANELKTFASNQKPKTTSTTSSTSKPGSRSLDDLIYNDDEDIAELLRGQHRQNNATTKTAKFNSILSKLANGNKDRQKFIENIQTFASAATSAPSTALSATLDTVAKSLNAFVYGEEGNDEENETVMQKFSKGVNSRIDFFLGEMNTKLFDPIKNSLSGENGIFTKIKQYVMGFFKTNVKNGASAVYKAVAGVKDATTGNYTGGAISDTVNTIAATGRKFASKVTGNSYVDETGKTVTPDKKTSIMGDMIESVKEFKKNTFGDSAEGKINPKQTYEKHIKPHLGDTMKGAGAMAAVSLLTPMGMLGAGLLGGTVGFISSSTNATEEMFGKRDKNKKSGADTAKESLGKVKQFYKDNKVGMVKGMKLGALTGLVGPTGILGTSIVLGTAGLFHKNGLIRDFLFGEKTEEGTRKKGIFGKVFGGILNNKFIKNMKNEITYYMKKNFINPLMNAAQPMFEAIKNTAKFGLDMAKKVGSKMLGGLKFIGKKLFGKDSNSKIGRLLGKAGKGAVKGVLAMGKAPGKMLDWTTNRIVKRHEKKGMAYVEDWKRRKEARANKTESDYIRNKEEAGKASGEFKGFKFKDEQSALNESVNQQAKSNSILTDISEGMKKIMKHFDKKADGRSKSDNGMSNDTNEKMEDKAKQAAQNAWKNSPQGKAEEAARRLAVKLQSGSAHGKAAENIGSGSDNDVQEMLNREANQAAEEKEKDTQNVQGVEQPKIKKGGLLGAIARGFLSVGKIVLGPLLTLVGTGITKLGGKLMKYFTGAKFMKNLAMGAATRQTGAMLAGGTAANMAGAAGGAAVAGAAGKNVAKKKGIKGLFSKMGGLIKKNPKTAAIAALLTGATIYTKSKNKKKVESNPQNIINNPDLKDEYVNAQNDVLAIRTAVETGQISQEEGVQMLEPYVARYSEEGMAESQGIDLEENGGGFMGSALTTAGMFMLPGIASKGIKGLKNIKRRKVPKVPKGIVRATGIKTATKRVATAPVKKGLFSTLGKGVVGLAKKNPKTAALMAGATVLSGTLLGRKRRSNNQDHELYSEVSQYVESGQMSPEDGMAYLQENGVSQESIVDMGQQEEASGGAMSTLGNAALTGAMFFPSTTFKLAKKGVNAAKSKILGGGANAIANAPSGIVRASGVKNATMRAANTATNTVAKTVASSGAKTATNSAMTMSQRLIAQSNGMQNFVANNMVGNVPTSLADDLVRVTANGGGVTKSAKALTSIKGVVTKITNSSAVKKVLGTKVGSALPKLGQWLVTKLAPIGAKLLPKLAAKWGALAAGAAATAGIGTAVWLGASFTNGCTKARQILGVGDDYKISAVLRSLAGAAHFVQENITFGFIKEREILDQLSGMVLSEKDAADLLEAQKTFEAGYMAYKSMPGNEGKSFDDYNKNANPSMVQSAMNTGKKVMNTVTFGHAFKDDVAELEAVKTATSTSTTTKKAPWYKRAWGGVKKFFGGKDEGGFGGSAYNSLSDRDKGMANINSPKQPVTNNVVMSNKDKTGSNAPKNTPTTSSMWPFDNSPADIKPQNINGLAYYSQGDSRWGSKQYGTATMKESACGPTSMAMLSTAVTGKLHSPMQMAQYALDNGFRVPGVGTSWGFFGSAGNKFNTPTTQMDAASAESAIRAGRPVVISGKGAAPFTKGGHFVVAHGMKGEDVYIQDPVSPGRTKLYPWATIKGMGAAYFASNKKAVMQPTGYKPVSGVEGASSDGSSTASAAPKKLSFGEKIAGAMSDIGKLTMGLLDTAFTGAAFNVQDLLEPNVTDGPQPDTATNNSTNSTAGQLPSFARSTAFDYDYKGAKKVGTNKYGDPVYDKSAIRSLSNNRQELIEVMAPYAMVGQVEHGVPASTFIAQSIQETGGTSVIGNNMHGIKAYRQIGQPVVKTKTQEHGIGTITDTFFGFDNLHKGAEGYYRFMEGSNYKNVHNSDWQRSLEGLTKYATDPNYISTLKGIVKSNNLTQWNDKAKSFYDTNVGGGNGDGGVNERFHMNTPSKEPTDGSFHVTRSSSDYGYSGTPLINNYTIPSGDNNNADVVAMLGKILKAINNVVGIPVQKIAELTDVIAQAAVTNNEISSEQQDNKKAAKENTKQKQSSGKSRNFKFPSSGNAEAISNAYNNVRRIATGI